jgi:hypothetical protein
MKREWFAIRILIFEAEVRTIEARLERALYT